MISLIRSALLSSLCLALFCGCHNRGPLAPLAAHGISIELPAGFSEVRDESAGRNPVNRSVAYRKGEVLILIDLIEHLPLEGSREARQRLINSRLQQIGLSMSAELVFVRELPWRIAVGAECLIRLKQGGSYARILAAESGNAEFQLKAFSPSVELLESDEIVQLFESVAIKHPQSD